LRRSLSASLVALVLVTGSVQAGQHQEKSDFETGVEAFEEGNLDLARRKFEQARAEGIAAPSLLYNLGVVYFRLEQYNDAERIFRLLLDSPHAPLAQYNLGLVSLKKDETDNARQWFRAAASETSPQKVQALAWQRLDEMGDGELWPVAGRRGSAYVSLSGGYSNNIAGTPDEASSNRSGAFADMLAAGRYNVGGNPERGLRLNGLVYSRQYPAESDFDNSFANIGASWLSQPGPGLLTSTVSAGYSWFGAETLEREVQFDVVYRLGSCPVMVSLGGLKCEFSGVARAIRGGSGFSAYDGELYRAGLKAAKRAGRWLISGGYSLEADNREDLSTEQEFYSLSPVRHVLVARTRYLWTQRIGLGLKADFRLSRYQDDHRLITNGVEISERREDRRLRGTVMLDYELSRQWQVITELSLLDNHSTIERYDFSQGEVMVGIQGSF